MIYLDNAATSLVKPEGVITALAEAAGRMGNAGRGANGASLHASRRIYTARCKIAAFFGAAGPEQVVFTANATESLNIAIQGLFSPGDHVITTALEHNSVLRPLYWMAGQGVSLTVIPADRRGLISYDDVAAAVRPETKAVVCTHASNVTGNMVDLLRVGEICKAHGILLVADISQTAGFYPVDMKRMGIDVLCFTGHKGLMGPQGIGGLCVGRDVVIRPLLHGGSGVHSFSKSHPGQMPEALEAGTLNGPGIAGLAAAVDYLEQTGIDTVRSRELALMRQFYDCVSDCPEIRVYGDFTAAQRAPIVSLNIGDYDSSAVADELFREYDIAVRAGAHCAPLMHEALGTVDTGAVRFSFSCMNTEDEVRTAAAAVLKLAKED